MTGRGVAFAAVAAMFGWDPIPPSVQEPTFHSRVEGVRIDALVTDRGTPVAGLTQQDFEVFDNGVAQAITVTPRADTPVRVLLAVDASRSMRGRPLDRLREAGKALVRALDSTDESSLVTFNGSVTQAVPPGRGPDRIDRALAHMTADGDTALVDATLAGILLGEMDPGRSLVMVFSDGADTASFLSEQVVLETARGASVAVYGVWSGRESPPFLRKVADVSGGRAIGISGSGALTQAFLEILREFRQRYLITFAPTGVAPGGWHELEVRLKGRRGTVRARRGYLSVP